MTMKLGFGACLWLQEGVSALVPGSRAVEALAWEVALESSTSLVTTFRGWGAVAVSSLYVCGLVAEWTPGSCVSWVQCGWRLWVLGGESCGCEQW